MYIIYSKPGCPHCTHAKQLFADRKLEYTELIMDVGQVKDPDKLYYKVDELRKLLPNVKTVPQVFVEKNGSIVHIGGVRDLELSFN